MTDREMLARAEYATRPFFGAFLTNFRLCYYIVKHFPAPISDEDATEFAYYRQCLEEVRSNG